MLNNIGWDGRLHLWRGSKTYSQAFLDETGSPQIFSLWVVQKTLPRISEGLYNKESRMPKGL